MHKIRIGTRGSAMAKRQAEYVRSLLLEAHDQIQVDIVEIRTSGDWKPEQGETRLSEVQGGKGLFAKEIEQRIINGEVDCGVHCVKDMPSFLPEGLEISQYLPRNDPRDALITGKDDIKTIADLPHGATIGTSSVRRGAILLAMRPDFNIVPFRGNLHTRIEKLKAGQVDATLLSYCGLERLELTEEAASVFSINEMLPACGQGGICIETRTGDTDIQAILAPLEDEQTAICMEAERTILKILDGSCHTPISAFALLQNGTMTITGQVFAEDGTQSFTESTIAQVSTRKDAIEIATSVGNKIKDKVPPALLEKDAA